MWGTSLTDRFANHGSLPMRSWLTSSPVAWLSSKHLSWDRSAECPSNKILRWYLIIPTTYKQNSSSPLQQKKNELPGISLASKQETKQLYTVSPFQSYRDRALYFSFTLTSYMWGICFGIILTDRQVLERWYFQRAHGHKCHSVNSQCAASVCRCRPENESVRRERREIQRNTARVTKSNQIDGAAQHI